MHKNYSTKRHKSYSKELGAIYVNFIIALLHNKLNLDRTKLKSYSNIIKFLEGYKGDKLYTKGYLSKLRYRGEFKKVPLTSESLDFINYVKKTFPDFNDSYFVYKHPTNTLKYSYPATTTQTKPKASVLSLRSKLKLQSLPNKYLWIYEEIAYFFILLPYFILLILAIKDNPELFDVYIKEWKSEIYTNTQTKDIDEYLNIDTYPDFVAVAPQTENGYADITDFYGRIEGVSSGNFEDVPSRWPYSNNISANTPISSESGSAEVRKLSDTTKTKAIMDTTYTYPSGQDSQAMNQQAKKITNNYSHSVFFNEDNQNTKDMHTTEFYKTKRKSSWWFSMLDFNNLNYFPSLFEDLSKPRETYTIVQSTNDTILNNTDVSTYKRYTNKTVNVSYLENAILKHISSESANYNTINIENTMVSSVAHHTDQPGANLSRDTINIVTAQAKASPEIVEATAKTNNVISKVDLAVTVPTGEVTVPTENITLTQNSSSVTQKTNTPSISYNLNRDSISSTYSKYFYYEDISTTDKVTTLRTQVDDKAVANTQVKPFVSEHIDSTEDINNKKTYDTANTYPLDLQANKFIACAEPVIPEPVTLAPQEQISNTDLSNSLHTNIKNSKLHLSEGSASYEPSSPYSPSIISDYGASSDIQVPNIRVIPATPPHVDTDIYPMDLQIKASDIVNRAHDTESLSFDNDLIVPEVKPTKITPPALFEDYIAASAENTVATRTNFDLTIPEAKPTKITPPTLDDPYNLSSFRYTHPEMDSLFSINTDNNPEHIASSTDNKLKLNTDFNTLHTAVGNSSLNIEETKGDLIKAKKIIAINNKQILHFESGLETLEERVNIINKKSTLLTTEKAELINELNEINTSNTYPSDQQAKTKDKDTSLTSIFTNAFNSFMQSGTSSNAPDEVNNLNYKLKDINIKLNALQEAKQGLLINIDTHNNSISMLNKHNLSIRQFIEEKTTALLRSGTSNN